MKDKKMQDLNIRKMERIEQLKIEIEMTDYFNSYEYELENEISNRELVNDIINDIMKF